MMKLIDYGCVMAKLDLGEDKVGPAVPWSNHGSLAEKDGSVNLLVLTSLDQLVFILKKL